MVAIQTKRRRRTHPLLMEVHIRVIQEAFLYLSIYRMLLLQLYIEIVL